VIHEKGRKGALRKQEFTALLIQKTEDCDGDRQRETAMQDVTQPLFTTDASTITRATVSEVLADGVVVAFPGDETQVCDVLDTVMVLTPLTEGDAVLVWLSPTAPGRGVILGRVGAPRPEPGEADELVLEAKKQLILRCGAGSITIREDGKILIKGKDLVSHAKRLNRIRGGSVQIN
jgi:hypothetical protein